MSQPAHDPRRMITDAIRRWQRSTVASRKWGKSVRWRKSSVDFQRRERFRETTGREPQRGAGTTGALRFPRRPQEALRLAHQWASKPPREGKRPITRLVSAQGRSGGQGPIKTFRTDIFPGRFGGMLFPVKLPPGLEPAPTGVPGS